MVFSLLAALLLARARSPGLVAQRAEQLAQAVALWPEVTAAMHALEAKAPAAAQAGWLADAEFMDMVEAVRGHAPESGDPLVAAAGFASVLMAALFEIVRAGPEPRGILRGRLETAFEAWPKVCRAMARLNPRPARFSEQVASD